MATFTWKGISGNYTDANWSVSGAAAGIAPGTLDLALFDGTTAYTVTFGHPAGTSVVTMGQNVTIDNPNAVIDFQTDGNLTALAGNTLQNNAGTLNITGAAGTISLGALLLVNGGTLNSEGHGAYRTLLPGTVDNSGLIRVSGDSLSFGSFRATNSGTIAISDGGTVTAALTTGNSGIITLASGGSLTLPKGLKGNVSTAGTIEFLDGGGSVLTIGALNNNTITTTIAGFRPGDTIDLQPSFFFADGETAAFSGGAIVLSEFGTPLIQLPAAGIPSWATLQVQSDARGYAEITMACFAEGTRIATARGPVAVEALRVGDLIVAPDGTAAPAIWLGHRRVNCRRHPTPQDVWPVRVQAGAFAPGLPQQDLWLSPDHAVFTGGVLIPVRYLLNGRTIAQVERAEVTYWHVELPRHGILLAEGLPCETYLDTGNRGAFAGGGPALHLHPDFARHVWQQQGCAPLVLDGPVLHRARARLLRRAAALGHARTHRPHLRLDAGGRLLAPRATTAGYSFNVPPGTATAVLHSRSGIPAHVHADSGDHRQLGIAVRHIAADGVTLALSDPRLGRGWHGVEFHHGAPAWRWTDGAAELDLRGVARLEIEAAMTMQAWRTMPRQRSLRAA